MRTFLSALALLMPALLGAQSPERDFWSWFAARDARLRATASADAPVCDTLMAMLQRVRPELTFEWGPVTEGRREFIISADGIRDAFPAVERLAAAAPALPHWTVIAFRPGRPGPHALTLGDRRLSTADVLVRAEPEGTLTGIVLALPGYRATAEKTWEHAGYLLLDAVLGEYLVETRIGSIGFTDVARRAPGRWVPLETFAAELRR